MKNRGKDKLNKPYLQGFQTITHESLIIFNQLL